MTPTSESDTAAGATGPSTATEITQEDLLALLESMHQTQIALAVMAALALVVAAGAFALAVAS